MNDISGATSFDEAVETARDWIEYSWAFQREKVFAFPPNLDLSPTRIRRWTSSRKGYDHLGKRIAATLRIHRQLPPNLSKIAAEMLEGKHPRFKKKRDLDLIIVIGMAVKKAARHLPKYRNEATTPQTSACDAVARAATLNGHAMTYDMVANRYRQYLDL